MTSYDIHALKSMAGSHRIIQLVFPLSPSCGPDVRYVTYPVIFKQDSKRAYQL